MPEPRVLAAALWTKKRGRLDRLQIDADGWQTTLCQLFSKARLVGSFFGQPAQLAAVAEAKGRQFVNTLPGRQAQLCRA